MRSSKITSFVCRTLKIGLTLASIKGLGLVLCQAEGLRAGISVVKKEDAHLFSVAFGSISDFFRVAIGVAATYVNGRRYRFHVKVEFSRHAEHVD